MTHTCEDCDSPLNADRDKAKGRYRDRCLDCIRADAGHERHVDTCDGAECLVCQDYQDEFA